MKHTLYTNGFYENLYTKGLEQTESSYIVYFKRVMDNTDVLKYQAQDDAIRHMYGVISLLIKQSSSDTLKDKIGLFKKDGTFAAILNVVGGLKYKNIAYIKKPLLYRRQTLTSSDAEACTKATAILRSIHNKLMVCGVLDTKDDKEVYLHSAVSFLNFLLNNNDYAVDSMILGHLVGCANHLYARLILMLFEQDSHNIGAKATWRYLRSVVNSLYGKNSVKANSTLAAFATLKNRAKGRENDFFNAFRWYLCNLFADDIVKKLEHDMRIRPELYAGKIGSILREKLKQFKSQSGYYDLFEPEESVTFPSETEHEKLPLKPHNIQSLSSERLNMVRDNIAVTQQKTPTQHIKGTDVMNIVL